MNSIRKLLTVAILAATTTAFAMPFDCFDGCWGVKGEFLYMEPGSGDFPWAQSRQDVGDTTNIRDIRVRPGYAPGFRVGIIYEDCCCNTFAALTYTRYVNTFTGVEKNGAFPDNVTTFGLGKAVDRQNWQQVDLRIGCCVGEICCWQVRWYGEAAYLYINRFRSRKLSNVDPASGLSFFSDSNWSEAHSGFVALGADFHRPLWCNFGIFADVNAGVGLVGVKGKSRRFDLNADGSIAINTITSRPYDAIIFGTVDLRLGVDYYWCCSCFNVTGSLGYEIISYALLVGDTGFNGLNAGLSVCF